MTPIDPTPVHHTEGGHQFSNVFRAGKADQGERGLLCRFVGDDHVKNSQEFCAVFSTFKFIERDGGYVLDITDELNGACLEELDERMEGAGYEVDLPNARPAVDILSDAWEVEDIEGEF